MKKRSEETQTLRAGCSKAEPKIFAPPQTPFPGARDGQNLISRWSQTGPITIHCAAASALCKYCTKYAATVTELHLLVDIENTVKSKSWMEFHCYYPHRMAREISYTNGSFCLFVCLSASYVESDESRGRGAGGGAGVSQSGQQNN